MHTLTAINKLIINGRNDAKLIIIITLNKCYSLINITQLIIINRSKYLTSWKIKLEKYF